MLVMQNIEQALIDATSPGTSVEVLIRLSSAEDERVRRAVAANPSLPLTQLWGLAREFPDIVLSNPILDLLYVADPNFVREVPEEAMVRLVSSPEFPSELFARAAEHRSLNVRRAVMRRPEVGGELIEKICRGYFLFEEAAEHPNTPPAYQLELARHPWPQVRLRLANNSAVRDEVLAVLLDDGELSVRNAAHRNLARREA